MNFIIAKTTTGQAIRLVFSEQIPIEAVAPSMHEIFQRAGYTLAQMELSGTTKLVPKDEIVSPALNHESVACDAPKIADCTNNTEYTLQVEPAIESIRFDVHKQNATKFFGIGTTPFGTGAIPPESVPHGAFPAVAASQIESGEGVKYADENYPAEYIGSSSANVDTALPRVKELDFAKRLSPKSMTENINKLTDVEERLQRERKQKEFIDRINKFCENIEQQVRALPLAQASSEETLDKYSQHIFEEFPEVKTTYLASRVMEAIAKALAHIREKEKTFKAFSTKPVGKLDRTPARRLVRGN